MHIVSKLYPSLENHPELNFLLCTQDKEHDNNTVGRAKVKAAKAGKESVELGVELNKVIFKKYLYIDVFLF